MTLCLKAVTTLKNGTGGEKCTQYNASSATQCPVHISIPSRPLTQVTFFVYIRNQLADLVVLVVFCSLTAGAGRFICSRVHPQS